MKWLILLMGILTTVSCVKQKKELFEVKGTGGKVYFTGLVKPEGFMAGEGQVESALKGIRAEVPSAFDWRTKVSLSPVYDQGNCGSCWANAVGGVFNDASIAMGSPKSGIASRQFLLDCNTKGYSCDGGWFDVHDMHINPGAKDEAQYPYVAKQNTCKGSSFSSIGKIASWKYLPTKDSAGNVDPSEIKAAIYAYGPIAVGVSASDSWSSYTGGVFSGCQNGQPNHAVELVGWDDAQGVYIMKNSWGSSWGEGGYMRIPYNCDSIGINANYVIVSKDNPTPGPTPDPTPGPTPPPVPPKPTPTCKPQPFADTGMPDRLQVEPGQRIQIGTRGRQGTTYRWSANPAFSGNAVPTAPMINFITSISKTLTITATTKCGSASDSVIFVVPNPTRIDVVK